MKILFVGGGTLGPVTPLLAIHEAWKKKDSTVEFFWIGTSSGPEKVFVEKNNIRFYSISKARMPRYVSFEWLLLPIKLIMAFVQTWKILKKEKPNVICAAGGYSSVPVVVLGKFMKIPSWVHQQDVHPSVSNIFIAPFAKLVTTAWQENLSDFPKDKTFIVGNPVRSSVFNGSKQNANDYFDLNSNKPTVLIFGGGTGSVWLNIIAFELQKELSNEINIIHLIGKGRGIYQSTKGYFVAETLSEKMADAYAVADIVICRAGMGTITELSALKKACIFIPIPHSHQEANANAVSSGSLVLDQDAINVKILAEKVLLLIHDDKMRNQMGEKLSQLLKTDVADELIDKIISLIQTSLILPP